MTGGGLALEHSEDSRAEPGRRARLQSRCGSDTRWGSGPGRPTEEPLAARPAALPTLGAVASAAAMFRNKELKLHPRASGPWILGLPAGARSASGVPGVSGPPGTQDPLPVPRRWPRAQPPWTTGKGEEVAARSPVGGKHPAHSPENVSSFLLAARRRPGRVMQGHCAFHSLTVPAVFRSGYFLLPQRESGSQGPPDPVRPFLGLGTQGIQDPLAMGWKWATIGTHRGTAPSAARGSTSVFLGNRSFAAGGRPIPRPPSLPVDDPGVLSFGEDSWDFSQAAPRSAEAAVGPGQRGTLRAPGAGDQSERVATSGPGPKERFCPRKVT